MIELVNEELKKRIEECFSGAETSIRIASPFLSRKTAKLLSDVCKANPEIECSLLTRLYMKDLLDGSNSLEALDLLLDAEIEVYALQGLHAKLYIFDEYKVIIGSANFTWSGMNKNCELSVLTDDSNVLTSATLFYDELVDYCKDHYGIVTKETLLTVRPEFEKAYKERQKDYGYSSTQMFGAERKKSGLSLKNENWLLKDLQVEDVDPVHDILSDTSSRKTDFKHNIWVKFEGKSENRQPGDGLPTLSVVELDGEKRFIINFRNRPRGILDGDQMYIVSLTSDENGKPTTRIVGRGKAKSYQNRNRVHSEWLKDHPWMSYYCFFCELADVELLNMKRMDCIPLEQVYNALGKNTYTSTIDKDEVKNMSLCQCRRSHIQMTLDAKQYIDNEIDRLAGIYGFIDIEQLKSLDPDSK